MRGTLLACLVALTGCAANAGIRTAGLSPETVTVGPAQSPASTWPKPATIEAVYPDGSPGRTVTIQAVDSDERRYYVATDELGRATLNIWTDRIPVWSQRVGDGWVPLVPARVRPADSGDGYRISVTLQGGAL